MKFHIDDKLLHMTSKVVFLTLEEEILKDNPDLQKLQGIEIPVFANVIVELAKQQKEGISTLEIASAMAFMMGVDPHFKHNLVYQKFIETFAEAPRNFFGYLSTQEYEKTHLLEAIVYLKGYLSFFEPDHLLVFNLGLLCQMAVERNIVKSPAERADFMQDSFEAFLWMRENYPAFILAEYYLGIQWMQKAFFEEARESFQKVIDSSDTAEDIREDSRLRLQEILYELNLNQAQSLMDEGRFEEAEQWMKTLEKDGIQGYQLYFLQGYSLRLQEKFEKALEKYELAFAVRPKDTRLLNELAICFAYTGDLDQATELLRSALDIEPHNPEILCNTAILEMNAGNLKEAQEYLEIAKEIAPTDPILLECLEALEKKRA